MLFRNLIVSKAHPLPEPPTSGGSYVLSDDGKRWTKQTPDLIEAPTNAANKESPDPGAA